MRTLLAFAILLLAPLAAIADDHLEKMAAEHQHDNASPSPAAKVEPAGPVEESRVAYATLDGKPITGFLARPKGAPAAIPGVIVIHEWWGLNSNVESMARQLAGEGYAVLAVDLYEGQSADQPEAARALMQGTLERGPRLVENLRQAASFLEKAGSARIGVVGWCFGGGWSLQTALKVPDKIQATVMYYGRVVTDPKDLAPLASPLLGLFGALDRGISADSVKQFEAALKTAGKDAEIHLYEGANHAFANPSGGNYNPAAAEDAWKKTLAFFARHLKG
ncbi:MAG TPA: dienelactone hydrolase family protein [Thermoanaerobaculia bacterium]|nr:dienelactone hydrolase family protein [Thermoanaerobaculia bacterium]